MTRTAVDWGAPHLQYNTNIRAIGEALEQVWQEHIQGTDASKGR